MKSCKVFAGNEELTAATGGETATSVTGSNDFTAPNCTFGYNEGNAACVVMATSSVYPSALASAAISVASTPDAAGRLSTTTGWPNRSESLGVMSRATRSAAPRGKRHEYPHWLGRICGCSAHRHLRNACREPGKGKEKRQFTQHDPVFSITDAR